MVDISGYITCVLLSAIALNVWPEVAVPLWAQGTVAAVACVVNFFVWKKSAVPPMSARVAAMNVAAGFGLVLLVAAIDIGIGFASGEKTLTAAFLKSGGAGAPVDIFLAAGLWFIGLPAVVRSLVLYYAQHRP